MHVHTCIIHIRRHVLVSFGKEMTMTHCLHVLSAKLSKQLGKCVCSSHSVQPGSIQLHIQAMFTHIRFHCESILIRGVFNTYVYIEPPKRISKTD